MCYAADLTVALAKGDAQAADAALAELQDKAPGSRFTAAAQGELSEHRGDQKDATLNYSRACMQGHTVSCKKLAVAADARKAEQPDR
jgi:TPR repeat protein